MNNMQLSSAAADLLSDEGENPEYDRAIVELTATLLGTDDREEVERGLRRMRHAPVVNVIVTFTAGRRGVNYPECRWCGRLIHRQLRGEPGWVDGSGLTHNDLGPGDLSEHAHEPALEEGPRLGPFEFVQVTYESLRDVEGREIAIFDSNRGDWIICEPYEGAGEAYSDMVVSVKEGS